MLSYQHAYHAGNLADVHKHALLACCLDYLTRKPKPLSYIETHSGRAIYDLGSDEALKTGEAARGISLVRDWFAPDHPYAKCLDTAQNAYGPNAYPGSPMIAQTLLRSDDQLTLAELHPQEVKALRAAIPVANVRAADGPQMALSMTPPTLRRGFLLIDPSYEVKTEWQMAAKLLADLHRKWAVGVLMLWYPILTNGAHDTLVSALSSLPEDKTLHHQVRFPPARPGHGMVGSGVVLVNPPWGIEDATKALSKDFATLNA